MAKVYLANSFSLNMFDYLESKEYLIKIRKIDEDFAKEILINENVESCIGHKETSLFLSKKLDIKIDYNRKEIKLKKGDKVLVCQIMCRLKEGQILSEKELEKIPINWLLVEIL